jgi:hypothetical protein
MKTKTRLLTLIIPSLILAATSTTVISADEPVKAMPDQAQSNQAAKPNAEASAQMKILDPDKDGTVSKTEAEKMKGLTEVFDAADKNKDGLLDTAELATALSHIKK